MTEQKTPEPDPGAVARDPDPNSIDVDGLEDTFSEAESPIDLTESAANSPVKSHSPDVTHMEPDTLHDLQTEVQNKEADAEQVGEARGKEEQDDGEKDVQKDKEEEEGESKATQQPMSLLTDVAKDSGEAEEVVQDADAETASDAIVDVDQAHHEDELDDMEDVEEASPEIGVEGVDSVGDAQMGSAEDGKVEIERKEGDDAVVVHEGGASTGESTGASSEKAPTDEVKEKSTATVEETESESVVPSAMTQKESVSVEEEQKTIDSRDDDKSEAIGEVDTKAEGKVEGQEGKELDQKELSEASLDKKLQQESVKEEKPTTVGSEEPVQSKNPNEIEENPLPETQGPHANDQSKDSKQIGDGTQEKDVKRLEEYDIKDEENVISRTDNKNESKPSTSPFAFIAPTSSTSSPSKSPFATAFTSKPSLNNTSSKLTPPTFGISQPPRTGPVSFTSPPSFHQPRLNPAAPPFVPSLPLNKESPDSKFLHPSTAKAEDRKSPDISKTPGKVPSLEPKPVESTAIEEPKTELDSGREFEKADVDKMVIDEEAKSLVTDASKCSKEKAAMDLIEKVDGGVSIKTVPETKEEGKIETKEVHTDKMDVDTQKKDSIQETQNDSVTQQEEVPVSTIKATVEKPTAGTVEQDPVLTDADVGTATAMPTKKDVVGSDTTKSEDTVIKKPDTKVMEKQPSKTLAVVVHPEAAKAPMESEKQRTELKKAESSAPKKKAHVKQSIERIPVNGGITYRIEDVIVIFKVGTKKPEKRQGFGGLSTVELKTTEAEESVLELSEGTGKEKSVWASVSSLKDTVRVKRIKNRAHVLCITVLGPSGNETGNDAFKYYFHLDEHTHQTFMDVSTKYLQDRVLPKERSTVVSFQTPQKSVTGHSAGVPSDGNASKAESGVQKLKSGDQKKLLTEKMEALRKKKAGKQSDAANKLESLRAAAKEGARKGKGSVTQAASRPGGTKAEAKVLSQKGTKGSSSTDTGVERKQGNVGQAEAKSTLSKTEGKDMNQKATKGSGTDGTSAAGSGKTKSKIIPSSPKKRPAFRLDDQEEATAKRAKLSAPKKRPLKGSIIKEDTGEDRVKTGKRGVDEGRMEVERPGGTVISDDERKRLEDDSNRVKGLIDGIRMIIDNEWKEEKGQKDRGGLRRCNVQSREDFFERLGTFEVWKWPGFGEGHLLSPGECARRGWYNSGMNEVTSTDGAQVKLRLEECATVDELVREEERVHRLICGEGHKLLSGWIGQSCPAGFDALGGTN